VLFLINKDYKLIFARPVRACRVASMLSFTDALYLYHAQAFSPDASNTDTVFKTHFSEKVTIEELVLKRKVDTFH